MYITFERGRTLTKFILAWILCSVAAVGAPNVQRDFASEENIRFKKDVGSLSTEFQQILPVQVDFGSLVDIINQLISGIEGNVTDLGKQLKKEASTLKQKLEERKAKTEEEISSLKMRQKSMKQKLESSEESNAKMEEKISSYLQLNLQLNLQLKEILKNISREQQSTKEEISLLQERLKSEGGQKLQTTAESINTTQSREKKLVYIGKYKADQKNWNDAKWECKKRGGDLAMHITKDDMDFVWSEAILPGAKEFRTPKRYGGDSTSGFRSWIGGRSNQENTNSGYEWLNGDLISAADGLWETSEPNAHSPCMVIGITNFFRAELRKDGTKGPAFGTAACSSKYPFFCQI